MTSQQQRFCPLCDQSFDGGEAVLRCDGCGVLHHPACWVKHGGCATQPAHLSNPIAQAYSQDRPPGAPAPHPGERLRAVPRTFAPIPEAGTQRPEALGSRTGEPRERSQAAGQRIAPGPPAEGRGAGDRSPEAREMVGARRPVHHVPPESPLAPPPAEGRRYAKLNKAERYPPAKTLPKVYGGHAILAYWYIPVAALVAVAVAFAIIWTVDRVVGGDGTPAADNGAGGGASTTTTPAAGGTPGDGTSTPSAGGTPAAGGKLPIGGVAVVRGTGDCLNVRVAPGRTNDAIVCLADGQKVTVLEGPQEADGLQWWKVKTNLGDGWAAEDYLEPE